MTIVLLLLLITLLVDADQKVTDVSVIQRGQSGEKSQPSPR